MHWRRPLIPTSFVAVAAVSLVAAGCGSSSSGSSSVASSGARPAKAQIQQETQQLVKFADCMRTHGVPTFPDPATSPRDFKQALDPSTTHSPAFQPALTACERFLPRRAQSAQSTAHTQAEVAAALAFARCIRSHGFPNFPDPTTTGDITHEMLAAAGINLNQPAVVQAGDACVGVTHGLITRADIARFVAGQ